MIKYLIGVVFVGIIVSFGFKSKKIESKPNVILILTDDQGWGDLSLHGNTVLETPNLDQLANEGMRFNNFYVSPLCAPTRASLLTGRYHLNTGVVSVSKGLEIMDTEETTLAEVFKANGYKTGIFGKWHNGEHYPNRPNDQGFDDFFGFCAGHLSNYFDTDLEHNNNKVKTKGFITDVLTDKAINFIDKNKDEPFFCYLPYNAPHSPFQVPDKYFDKYKAKGLDDELASIYGMVENVDDNVARLMHFLKTSGLEENTIVVFMTDNGPNSIRYNGELKGIKGSVNEGGVKVPFFIKWKNYIKPKQQIESLAAHIDVYPTLVDLCGLKAIPTKEIHGKSFAKEILGKGNTKSINRMIFTHVNFMSLPVMPYSGGFRDEEYRYVLEKDMPQLYKLQDDPSQKNNLAMTQPILLNKYREIYTNWFIHTSKNIQSKRSTVLSEKGVYLPMYEANLTNGLKYKEGHGWAHDWLEVWNSPKDSFSWDIDIAKPGSYSLEMEYLCAEKDIGSTISYKIGNVEKTVLVNNSFNGIIKNSPDRIVRKEAYEIESWGKLSLGQVNLTEGNTQLVFNGVKLAGRNFAEVNGVRIIYVGE